jgi:hypothetical protein
MPLDVRTFLYNLKINLQEYSGHSINANIVKSAHFLLNKLCRILEFNCHTKISFYMWGSTLIPRWHSMSATNFFLPVAFL